MLKPNDMAYFMFSEEQMKIILDIEKEKMGKNVIFGNVIVKGEAKQYTEILSNPNKSRYSDAILVASGILKDMQYTRKRWK